LTLSVGFSLAHISLPVSGFRAIPAQFAFKSNILLATTGEPANP
jgi:hypothetical protein